MARYTKELQDTFKHIDGQDTVVVAVNRGNETYRSHGSVKLISILAIAAAVSGIAAGVATNPSPESAQKNQTSHTQGTAVIDPNNPVREPGAISSSPEVLFEPTDFSLEFHKFSTNDGCKSFGKIVVADQVLTAQIGAQPYAIEIESATTEFYTCTNDAKVSFKNGELDAKENAYPEIVELDATSLTYDAVLSDVEMSMRPITPKEQLQEDGTEEKACAIFDVCSIDTTQGAPLPKEVTDVVLASAKAQIVTSAQDAFAKIEHKAMTLDILNDLYAQADELHVNRDLVQFSYVNKDGKVINAVPNYPSPLLKSTLKEENAAITKKDLKGIFGDAVIAMQYIPNEEVRR